MHLFKTWPVWMLISLQIFISKANIGEEMIVLGVHSTKSSYKEKNGSSFI